jgi:hypothetical protein
MGKKRRGKPPVTASALAAREAAEAARQQRLAAQKAHELQVEQEKLGDDMAMDYIQANPCDYDFNCLTPKAVYAAYRADFVREVERQRCEAMSKKPIVRQLGHSRRSREDKESWLDIMF